jgi:hypothetical protein
MEEKEINPLEGAEHNWVYDTFAGFYFCVDCKIEISQGLYEFERDDNPEMSHSALLDRIVDVECE